MLNRFFDFTGNLLYPNDIVITQSNDFEMKYKFQNFYAQALIGWLELHYLSDEKYPEAKVQSIYMEDMWGTSYSEKINSDFFKTKYRVRWYEEVNNSLQDKTKNPTVFLEKKMKIGSQREKKRDAILLDSTEVLNLPLHHDSHKFWKQCFFERGVCKNIEPLIQISYMRKRYVEESSKTRINIDYNISIEKSNCFYLPQFENVMLPDGVLEVKRSVMSPPESLHYLTRNIVRKSNFSKYEQCLSVLKNMF